MMINEADFAKRGWNVLPCFTPSAQLSADVFQQMEHDKEAPGKSSWGTRNLLFALTLSLRPKTVLEIGGHIGSASVAIGAALKANNFGRLFTLEPQDHYFAILKKNLELAGVQDFVTPLQVLSTDAGLARHLGDSPDLVYLDANHSYSHAAKDIEIAHRLLPDNGVLILDDVGPVVSAQLCKEGRGGVRQALIDHCAATPGMQVIFLEPPFWLNPCGIALACKQAVIPR
jgi:predicted O-methyltransferase YrrM